MRNIASAWRSARRNCWSQVPVLNIKHDHFYSFLKHTNAFLAFCIHLACYFNLNLNLSLSFATTIVDEMPLFMEANRCRHYDLFRQFHCNCGFIQSRNFITTYEKTCCCKLQWVFFPLNLSALPVYTAQSISRQLIIEIEPSVNLYIICMMTFKWLAVTRTVWAFPTLKIIFNHLNCSYPITLRSIIWTWERMMVFDFDLYSWSSLTAILFRSPSMSILILAKQDLIFNELFQHF